MKAVMLAIGAGLCWGIGEVCTRSALHGGKIGPIGAITVRSLVAVPLLLLVFWMMTRGSAGLRTEPALTEADGATWAKITLGSGIVAGGLAMVLFYSALSLGEVSIVKPIAFAIAPAVGVLLGWIVLGEAMDWRKAVAVGLILAGVVLLTTSAGATRHAITPSVGSSEGMGGQPV